MHTIVYRYPPTWVLSSEEQDLLWKFRFYLSSHKKALTKFLKCINWETNAEVHQALSLLVKWAPMDVEDALELLSPSFTHPEVRKYAIGRLAQAPDEDLLLYLLQLVQALKYENFNDIMELHKRIFPERDFANSLDDQSSLCSDISTGAASGTTSSAAVQRNVPTVNTLSQHTTVQAEMAQKSTVILVDSPTDDNVNPDCSSSLASATSDTSNTLMGDNAVVSNSNSAASDLPTFLIQRACKNPTLANYFYWYLSIEVEDQDATRKQDERVHDMYAKVLKIFLKVLENGKL